MPEYNYKAVAKDGRVVEGSISASDRTSAFAAVRKAGHRPISVSPAASGAGASSFWNLKIGSGRKKRMKPVEVLLFTSELADLIEAGMTLGQALGALASQGGEDSPQHFIARDLCDRIVRGESFSEALGHHSETFPPLYANMVRAGEASGALVEVLHRLAEHYERNDSMRSKIKSAMSYPIFVLIFGVGAVVFMLTWLVPKFERVFKALGASLPLPTKLLLGASRFMIANSLYIAAGAIALFLFVRWWKKTPSGRKRIDGWKLKAPLIKGIAACGAYSTLAYTLKTLLANGVNILQALKIAEDTSDNAVIAEALANARKRVTDGTSISGPLAASGAFPRMMTDMLGVGEQAGDMVSSLDHIGRRYEKDMERHIAAFTSALEPIIIVVLALIVGFVAIAILSAVFSMSSAIK